MISNWYNHFLVEKFTNKGNLSAIVDSLVSNSGTSDPALLRALLMNQASRVELSPALSFTDEES